MDEIKKKFCELLKNKNNKKEINELLSGFIILKENYDLCDLP